MYLAQLGIKNLGPISALEWAPPPKDLAGWHVVLGNNGSGKSSLLRAMALAWVGFEPFLRWIPDIRALVKDGEPDASISLRLSARHPATSAQLRSLADNYEPSNPNRQWFDADPTTTYTIRAASPGIAQDAGTFVDLHRARFAAAGFGTGRRFLFDDARARAAYANQPAAARFVTLLDPGTSLIECLEWLRALRFSLLDAEKGGDPSGGPAGRQLWTVSKMVRRLSLREGALSIAEVTPKAVMFRDGFGARVAAQSLSDGLQAVLGIVLEVARVLAQSFPDHVAWAEAHETGVLDLPACVIIDEVDVHLHALWQRQIGELLQTIFPGVQFIVSSHSPLVCQCNPRSIFRLDRAEQGAGGRMIEGEEYYRIVNGDVAEALATPAFSQVAGGRSAAAQALVSELAALNVRALRGKLDAEDAKRRDELRLLLPEFAHTLEAAE